MVPVAPMRTVPSVSFIRALNSFSASQRCRQATETWRKSSSPSGVKVTPFLERQNRMQFNSLSILLMHWLTVGWER